MKKSNKIITATLVLLLPVLFLTIIFEGCKSKPHIPDRIDLINIITAHYGTVGPGMNKVFSLNLNKHGDYMYTGEIELMDGRLRGKENIKVYIDEEYPYTVRWEIGR